MEPILSVAVLEFNIEAAFRKAASPAHSGITAANNAHANLQVVIVSKSSVAMPYLALTLNSLCEFCHSQTTHDVKTAFQQRTVGCGYSMLTDRSSIDLQIVYLDLGPTDSVMKIHPQVPRYFRWQCNLHLLYTAASHGIQSSDFFPAAIFLLHFNSNSALNAATEFDVHLHNFTAAFKVNQQPRLRICMIRHPR